MSDYTVPNKDSIPPALELQTTRDRLTYAFGHISAAWGDDAHAGDSADLGHDVLADDLKLSEREILIVKILAEHVYFNFDYTGKGEETRRQIERGEL